MSLTIPEHTYGLTFYVEVDATSEADAIKQAKKYLAPSYRENWEPLTVEHMEPGDLGKGTARDAADNEWLGGHE